jgi:hypothetical protein
MDGGVLWKVLPTCVALLAIEPLLGTSSRPSSASSVSTDAGAPMAYVLRLKVAEPACLSQACSSNQWRSALAETIHVDREDEP